MYPTLIEIFGQPLPAYFTFLLVGFGLAIGLAQRQARRFGLDHDTAIDLGLYALVWGVIGGRILHVFADGYFWDYVHLCTDPSQVAWQITEARCANVEGVWDAAASVCRPAERDCFAWAAFWRGGLAYYGGLLAAGAFGLWFLRKEKFPIGKGIDLVGLVIPLGLFFGRLGCFFGGCCFGTTVDAGAFGAVRFPEWSAASESQWKRGLLSTPGELSLPVHPTQLYESAGCL
ncbi:MAG: prolipoprotein diacylglyceryl transferase [Polyangiales bacterium]